MHITQLSKKKYKEILSMINRLGLQITFLKTKNVKAISNKRGELILVDDIPCIIHIRGLYIPFIGALEKFRGYKKIYVDKDAVKYLTNGANVMRPGIVSWEEFKEDEIIVVYVEEYNAPILVGIAVISSKKLEEKKKGKVVLNLHHIGDEFWMLSQKYNI